MSRPLIVLGLVCSIFRESCRLFCAPDEQQIAGQARVEGGRLCRKS